MSKKEKKKRERWCALSFLTERVMLDYTTQLPVVWIVFEISGVSF